MIVRVENGEEPVAHVVLNCRLVPKVVVLCNWCFLDSKQHYQIVDFFAEGCAGQTTI